VSAVSRKPRRRRRLLVACGAVVLLVGACTMVLPEFEPVVGSPEMAAKGLASRFVPSPHGPLHVVAATPAEPERPSVLAIHGSPGTWDAFRGVLEDPELRARARLFAFDRPGFGASGRGAAEPSLARQAEAAAAVLEAERAAPAVLVGHSLGGPIAVRLAIDRPELVAGLVLVAPSIAPELEHRRWYNVAGSLRLIQLFLPTDWVTSNRELWPLREELRELLPRWRELGVATIVVQGEKDDLVDPETADFAQDVIPGPLADIRRIPDYGHFVLWQRPDLVRRAILDALDRAAAPRRQAAAAVLGFPAAATR
jgi:pimeloyl-ACP methyl ester carboxylesterase